MIDITSINLLQFPSYIYHIHIKLVTTALPNTKSIMNYTLLFGNNIMLIKSMVFKDWNEEVSIMSDIINMHHNSPPKSITYMPS